MIKTLEKDSRCCIRLQRYRTIGERMIVVKSSEAKEEGRLKKKRVAILMRNEGN